MPNSEPLPITCVLPLLSDDGLVMEMKISFRKDGVCHSKISVSIVNPQFVDGVLEKSSSNMYM